MRRATWKRGNRVIVHIQGNLDGALDLAELAEVARFSPYHFHRLFQAFMDETMHADVCRLRLEAAAVRLITRETPITDLVAAVRDHRGEQERSGAQDMPEANSRRGSARASDSDSPK